MLGPVFSFLAKRQSVRIPYLPIRTQEEKALFSNLVGDGFNPDYSRIASDFITKADGESIFYKHPLYIKRYYDLWSKSQNSKATMPMAPGY